MYFTLLSIYFYIIQIRAPGTGLTLTKLRGWRERGKEKDFGGVGY
jgi:hypothetical protein